jgi:hypothetical protein
MVCAVPSCVADALRGTSFCGPHVNARTAKELRLGPDTSGHGAVRCGKCRRAFKDDDYVERQSYLVKTPRGPVTKWLHVVCVPGPARPSKKAILESEKPLLTAASE